MTTPKTEADGILGDQDPNQRLHCAIFCGPGSEDVVEMALRLYKKAELGIDAVIVAPRDVLASRKIKTHAWEVVADEDIVGIAKVQDWLRSHADEFRMTGRSPNWYRQQYLKLAYAHYRKALTFIHDGDTIFAPALLAAITTQSMLLTTREDPTMYNEGCNRLHLPTPLRASLVANGGLFDGGLLRDFGVPMSDWFIAAMKVIVLDSPGADFSEYQIMGQMASTRHAWPSRLLKLFRRFDLLTPLDQALPSDDRINRALSHYDALAFERGHRRNLYRRVLGHAAYWGRRTW